MTRPDAVTISYGYDAVGRRIQRTPSVGATEKYVYDGQDVVRDLHADGSVAVEYLNGLGIDNKLRQTDSMNENLYYTTDHLGSTRSLTDASGNSVATWTYDSFGNVVSGPAAGSFTRYTYTGRELDSDTGLMYYRARWYDPQIGRFISEDPIGFRGRDVNFYGYVKNSPLFYRDPSGLQRCDPIVGAILGGGVGGVVGIIGGALLGPPVGAVLGAATFGTAGTFVEPGGGTILGGGGGAVAGAAAGGVAGPWVGGVIGAGIGAYIGHRICSADTTCDKTPDNVIPFPTPKPTPMPPPPPPKPPGPGDECYKELGNCLRFAGTDPVRSAACQAQFVECMRKKGLPTLWP